jgi:hypothetical protein
MTYADTIGLRAGKLVYSYEGWWGYDSMPVIYSTNGSEYQTGNWAQEIINGEDSVTGYWISKGMDGWRLDVANEVSDETWRNFRDSVKALDSEAVIIGEIWDDATKYLMGDMYDSVMNYLFRNAVTGFAMGTDAEKTTKELEKVRERYPEEAFYAMMNLVGSHDTTRILSYLDGIGDDRNQKDFDSAFPTYEGTSQLAKDRQHLVAFLQFTYAGAPTIYYGDEIGMVGSDDPDDRRAFEWGKGSRELVEYYAKLAAIRNAYPALRTGSLNMEDVGNSNLLAFTRHDSENEVIVLANNSQHAQTLTELVAGEWIDLLTGTVYGSGDLVKVPAMGGVILVPTEQAKEISVDTEALAPAWDPAYIVGADRFTDVPEGTWYTESVRWARENHIVEGLDETHFGPNDTCSRAQIITFLWRAAGEPVAESAVNPFTDVTENDYFYDAVLWGVEQEIITGVSANEFAPHMACSRAQVVTFLWRAEGRPVPAADVSFSDVPSGQFYTAAVAWALEKGITTGISANCFGTHETCTRAQAVTFLYRAFANK